MRDSRHPSKTVRKVIVVNALNTKLFGCVALLSLMIIPLRAEAGHGKPTFGKVFSPASNDTAFSPGMGTPNLASRRNLGASNASQNLTRKQLSNGSNLNGQWRSSNGSKYLGNSSNFGQLGETSQSLQRRNKSLADAKVHTFKHKHLDADKTTASALPNSITHHGLDAAAIKNSGWRSTALGGTSNASSLEYLQGHAIDLSKPIDAAKKFDHGALPAGTVASRAASDLIPSNNLRGKIGDAVVDRLKRASEPLSGIPIADHGEIAEGVFDSIVDEGTATDQGNGNTAPSDPTTGNNSPSENNSSAPNSTEPPCDADEPPNCLLGEHHHHHHHCIFPWWSVFCGVYEYGSGQCTSVTNVSVIEQPVVVTSTGSVSVTPNLVAGVELELLDVRLADSGDTERKLGPQYRITFRNRGSLPVGNFQVLIMANRDGQPSAEAPMAIAEVAALAAGEVTSVDIRLPLSPELANLPALIVVLDSVAQVAEIDEQNNVVVLDRARIAMTEPTAAQTPVAADY